MFVFKSISVRFISVLHDGFVEIEECIGDERVGGGLAGGSLASAFLSPMFRSFFAERLVCEFLFVRSQVSQSNFSSAEEGLG